MTSKARTGQMRLKISEDDDQVAYLELPTYPAENAKAAKSTRLFDLIGKFAGPEIVLDFDDEGVLIGIEIVG